MRILQTIILSSLLLLIASNAYPQKDKSLQNVFIPEGYALDRNQVQYNQPKDFISFVSGHHSSTFHSINQRITYHQSLVLTIRFNYWFNSKPTQEKFNI